MRWVPDPGLYLWGGWLPLAGYFISLALHAASYPPDKRKKLFLKPGYASGDWRKWVRLLGTLAAIAYVGTMILTPLCTRSVFLYSGFAVYVAGFLMVMVALREFKGAPVDRPVTTGVYRLSRNPQWVGLFLVYLGAAIAVASWLHLALHAVLTITYHYQILLEEEICLCFYGEEYEAYMKQVRRYVGF